MNKAVPYIVLGIFSAIGMSLMVGGCVSDNRWWSLIILAPGVLALLCQIGVSSYTSSDGWEVEGGCITLDTWLYFLAMFIGSCIAMPLVFWHRKMISVTGLALAMAGAGVFIIGYIIFSCLDKKQKQEENGY